MSFSAYVICATQRSGSTLLCDLLTASGVAGQPDSYFASQYIDYWAGLWGVGRSIAATDPQLNRDYLAAMKRAGTANTDIFGLRLMWYSIGAATERLTAAIGSKADFASKIEQAFGPTLFIHLSRRDKVAQAVSLVRAEQTGLWHVTADGAERERTGPAHPPVFDAGKITRARDMLASDDAGWSSFFDDRGIQPLRMMYEDLAADPRATLAEALAALGRDQNAAARVSVQTGKLADAVSAKWVEAYGAGVTAFDPSSPADRLSADHQVRPTI